MKIILDEKIVNEIWNGLKKIIISQECINFFIFNYILM